MYDKDLTPEEYEKIVKELRNENESLKMRIVELEEEIKILLGPQEPIKEIQVPEFQYETKTPELEKELTVSNIFLSQDTVPLEMGKGPIVEGISRRECPICGNTNKALIYENVDRTHMISYYPKLYGKKYKCGQCGREWRLPSEV
ncbi:MAG: hypothetical protein ACFE9J_10525 [Candidatus Hermodarchaeota archaeon]